MCRLPNGLFGTGPRLARFYAPYGKGENGIVKLSNDPLEAQRFSNDPKYICVVNVDSKLVLPNIFMSRNFIEIHGEKLSTDSEEFGRLRKDFEKMQSQLTWEFIRCTFVLVAGITAFAKACS